MNLISGAGISPVDAGRTGQRAGFGKVRFTKGEKVYYTGHWDTLAMEKIMGKIFCLMGKSASGKDTIYGKLLKQPGLNLKRVIPYTTRPVRSGEREGETYFFRTLEQAAEMERSGKIIEIRDYHTVHGLWRYFTADDGHICLERDSYLMIGTLEAYGKIRDYFGAESVVPLYVWVDDGLRLERALAREREQANPRYAEMCRRFLADEEDFSEEKLAQAGIQVRFENQTMEQVLEDMIRYIRDEAAGRKES